MQNHNMHGKFTPTTPNMQYQFGNNINTYSKILRALEGT
jgi:hypothetical protein